jgi:hypothetical protein
MKSKNPQAFWLRWISFSALHAIGFTWIWGSNAVLFANWHYFVPFHFISGIALAGLQYWAMPLVMRPNVKRWFSANILGHALGVSLHALNYYLTFPPPNFLAIALTLYLAPALAQSWALSERFKKAWIFGLAFLLPSFISLGIVSWRLAISYYEEEFAYHFLRTVSMGFSLAYLQNYQLKEAVIAIRNETLKRKEAQKDNHHNEEAEFAEQKMSSSTK